MPTIKTASKFTLLAMTLLLTIGSGLQLLNLQVGVLATQWLLILPLALFFLKKHKLGLSFARAKSFKKGHIPAIILLAFSIWLLGIFMGIMIVEFLLSQGFRIPQEVIFYPKTTNQLLQYFLTMVVSSSICEEFFFRGIIMPTAEQEGHLQGIVFSSLLFALIHVSVLKIIVTFVLGLLIGSIVIKTDSLWSGVLLHALYNGFSIMSLYLISNQIICLDYKHILFFPIISIFGLWLGMKKLCPEKKFETSSRWLPKGWLNWATIMIIAIFFVSATMELYAYFVLGGGFS